MSVARSASGDGARPAASSFARTKRSISLRTQPCSPTSGGIGRDGATNAQCGLYSAPSRIHRSRSFFCASESRRFEFGGGMITSGSVELIRSRIALAPGSPGTIARASTAASRTSSRRSASRFAGS